MKKSDGYLQLDFSLDYENLVKDKIITPLDRNKKSFYVNSLNAFFKETDNGYLHLLGFEIGKLLNIDVVHYMLIDIITSNDTYRGVLSNNFNEDGYKLISVSKIIEEYLLNTNEKINYNDMNLELLYKAFSFHYNNNLMIVDKIMNQIKEYFLFDVLIGNIDNGKYNYEILENDKTAKMTPYFDFGQIFKFGSTRFTVSDNGNFDIYDNLFFFLEKEQNYITYFKNMYNILTPDKVLDIFTKIEAENGIKINENEKNIMFLLYARHYQCLGNVLNKLNSKRKK